VGTTITLGLAAMARGLADRTGLVTALPPFRDLPLPEPGDFVVGGHEIRSTTFAESAEEFRRTSGVFDPAWIAACRAELDAASARVRPGPRLGLSAVVSLYALAAIEGGHSHINFTPSLGGSMPAIHELAQATGALHAGKDGKTGETLMKTVLAPMFAHRNLKVSSWVGHNIFGNRDGLVLDDPTSKTSKVETKDRVITEILGYKPSSIVTIEYLPDMGDWKTAWDHIHFQGFLGTKMTLQFTWQGCDSLLAAPLAIDLARLTDLEKQRGGKGQMRHLACFFKSPEGVMENDFFKQFDRLIDHVAKPQRP